MRCKACIQIRLYDLDPPRRKMPLATRSTNRARATSRPWWAPEDAGRPTGGSYRALETFLQVHRKALGPDGCRAGPLVALGMVKPGAEAPADGTRGSRPALPTPLGIKLT